MFKSWHCMETHFSHGHNLLTAAPDSPPLAFYQPLVIHNLTWWYEISALGVRIYRKIHWKFTHFEIVFSLMFLRAVLERKRARERERESEREREWERERERERKIGILFSYISLQYTGLQYSLDQFRTLLEFVMIVWNFSSRCSYRKFTHFEIVYSLM